MDLLKNLDDMMTAENFLRYKSNINEDKNCVEYLKDSEVEDIMIEFAKFHVEAALKQASINANLYLHNTGWKHSSDIKTVKCHNYDASINKDSILTAYPLENIK